MLDALPADGRRQCVEHYSAALSGTRGQFVFHSYGHTYTVDAVPVRAVAGAHRNRVDGVRVAVAVKDELPARARQRRGVMLDALPAPVRRQCVEHYSAALSGSWRPTNSPFSNHGSRSTDSPAACCT